MNNFQKIQEKTLEEFAQWMATYGNWDNTPWVKWFNESYCTKCPSIRVKDDPIFGEYECCYCEVHNKCAMLPELSAPPSCEDIVRLWLQSPID